MKKTIRVIDLLNKIANGEEVPKKFKYDNYVFIYDNKKKDYIYKYGNVSYFDDYIGDIYHMEDILEFLSYEVEILDEEEFETIEELLIEYDDGDIGINKKYISSQQSEIFAKSINQLIKNQKKIIQKLNKEN